MAFIMSNSTTTDFPDHSTTGLTQNTSTSAEEPATTGDTIHATGDEDEEDAVALRVLAIVHAIVQCVGIVGNILIVVVVLRPGLRRRTIMPVLCALAVANILAISGQMGDFGQQDNVFAHPNLELSDTYCRINYWFNHTFPLVSNWLIVQIAVERLVAVWFYARAADLCTRSRALGFCIAIYLLAFCLYSVGVSAQFADDNRCVTLSTSEMVNTVGAVRSILYTFVPIPSLIVLNALTCGRVYLHHKHMPGKVKASHSSVSLMLVATSVLFLALVMSFTVLHMLVYYAPVLPHRRVLDHVGNTLMTVNHSISFFVYILLGKRFRKEFLGLFPRCGRNSAVVAPAPSGSTALNPSPNTRTTKM